MAQEQDPSTQPEAFPQSREQFIAERRTGIGGSDAAVILGLSPWMSPLELWAVKTGKVEEKDLSDNEFIEMGMELEPVIGRLYAKKAGRTIIRPPESCYRSPAHPFMIGHPDFLVAPRLAGGADGYGILDAKNASGFKASEWEAEGHRGAEIFDSPIAYQVQVQHYLSVLDLKWGALGALIGGNRFRFHEFDRNDEFLRALVEVEEAFWDKVQRDIPPEPKGLKGESECIRRLFPESNGGAIYLPPEVSEIDGQLVEWKARKKEADREVERLTNTMKLLIGDNAAGILPDGTRYTLSVTRNPGFTVGPFTFRALRRSTK